MHPTKICITSTGTLRNLYSQWLKSQNYESHEIINLFGFKKIIWSHGYYLKTCITFMVRIEQFSTDVFDITNKVAHVVTENR